MVDVGLLAWLGRGFNADLRTQVYSPGRKH